MFPAIPLRSVVPSARPSAQQNAIPLRCGLHGHCSPGPLARTPHSGCPPPLADPLRWDCSGCSFLTAAGCKRRTFAKPHRLAGGPVSSSWLHPSSDCTPPAWGLMSAARFCCSHDDPLPSSALLSTAMHAMKRPKRHRRFKTGHVYTPASGPVLLLRAMSCLPRGIQPRQMPALPNSCFTLNLQQRHRHIPIQHSRW